MIKSKLDILGKRFGRLVTKRVDRTNGKHTYWMCVCDCGTEKSIRRCGLVSGMVMSCGCLHSESARIQGLSNATHGESRVGSRTPEYRTWASMKERCYDPKQVGFHAYGGRGIKVCDRWYHSFDSFLADMGRKPSSAHSIERRDNNGDYEPSNCYWATLIEQANNKRSNRVIIYNGKSRTVAQWGRELGIPGSVIRSRIYSGWAAEKALTQQLRGR